MNPPKKSEHLESEIESTIVLTALDAWRQGMTKTELKFRQSIMGASTLNQLSFLIATKVVEILRLNVRVVGLSHPPKVSIILL